MRMSIDKNNLKQKWNGLRDTFGAMQRIDPDHPLHFFVGISREGYDELALFTTNEPSQIKSSKALEVQINLRNDGKWATQIYSVDKANQDIFARLCVDLIECSKNARTETEGLELVAKRYLAWSKLFVSINDNLPISVLKGLLGELCFIKALLSKGISADKVLDAWQGPEGADRDFVLGELWYEIKAISTGKDILTISSLNQLESKNKGYLVVYCVDSSTKSDSSAKSVKESVDEIREILQNFPDAQDEFEKKLILIGYIDKKAYEDMFFVIGIQKVFEVNDTFPRLITGTVPPEVTGVRYDLSISGIDEWKVEDFDYEYG